LSSVSAPSRRRIGLLTGGGDCPGLNAVIRAVVLSAVRQYQCDVIGIEDGFDGLLNDRFRPLTLEDVRGILTQGGTILGTSNRGNPFFNSAPSQGGDERISSAIRASGRNGDRIPA